MYTQVIFTYIFFRSELNLRHEDETWIQHSLHFVPVLQYQQCLEIKFIKIICENYVSQGMYPETAFHSPQKSFHELSLRLYNLHWCILLKRTPRISFFGGHKARKQLPLLSTFWKTPAAASDIAHASPLNLIVVVQSDSCDRHMNSKFARAMASCSRLHLLEINWG